MPRTLNPEATATVLEKGTVANGGRGAASVRQAKSQIATDSRWWWDHAAQIYENAVVTQAQDEATRPSGLPWNAPSDEEWLDRGKRAVEMMKQWAEEEPSHDLAALDELKKGLRENPVGFREVKLDD